jgi:hypothetical protein
MARSKIKVRERQTIWDVCLQETGGLNAVFAICEQNGFDIDVPIYTGQILVFDVAVENQQVVEHYRQKGHHPVNGLTMDELAGMPADFYWSDFDPNDFNTGGFVLGDFHAADFHELDFHT